ncbi:MAG: CcmD family protein [Acidobacteria bacterium]|nr:CcmD family protein [Acidobacteriota bacterium]
MLGLDRFGVSQGKALVCRRLTIVAVLIVCLGLLGATTTQAAQPAQPSVPEGFVPMEDVPPEDQLPAAPLLAAAYVVVWVIALGYLWTIWRRLGSVEKELADAMRRVGADGA